MSNVVPFHNDVPDILRDMDIDDNDALSAGLSGGFGVLSIKGGKFHIKYGGESELVTVETEDGELVPKMSLEVVLLKSSPHIAKTYYEGDYTEGSKEEPDCFSLDGETPSSKSPMPQSNLCTTCPMNEFGSKISKMTGNDSKACGDSRRVAVVPAGDIDNEQYGGPMLLRIPVMSLGDLGTFGKKMKQRGFPYNSIVTRLSFDPEAEYPKLLFKAARPLSTEQAHQVVAHLQDEKVEKILMESREFSNKKEAKKGAPGKPKAKPKPKKAEAVDTAFDDEDDTPAPPQPKKAKAKAKTKAKAAPKPIVESDDDLDDAIADVFSKMDSDT